MFLINLLVLAIFTVLGVLGGSLKKRSRLFSLMILFAIVCGTLGLAVNKVLPPLEIFSVAVSATITFAIGYFCTQIYKDTTTPK